MSCIRFTTSAQRAQIQRDSAAIDAADAAVLHLAPPVTESKLARLRLLAQNASPGIRQSVASNRHAPADLLATLAVDPEAAVRGEVARNEAAPVELVERLAQDPDARVRCWAVLNPGLPASVVPALLEDADPQVRRLAGWRREHVAV
jgi:Leucine rich repeat variant